VTWILTRAARLHSSWRQFNTIRQCTLCRLIVAWQRTLDHLWTYYPSDRLTAGSKPNIRKWIRFERDTTGLLLLPSVSDCCRGVISTMRHARSEMRWGAHIPHSTLHPPTHALLSLAPVPYVAIRNPCHRALPHSTGAPPASRATSTRSGW